MKEITIMVQTNDRMEVLMVVGSLCKAGWGYPIAWEHDPAGKGMGMIVYTLDPAKLEFTAHDVPDIPH